MSTPSSSKRGSAPFGGSRLPPGSRPPPYNWALIIARLIIILCLVLVGSSELLLGWADAQPMLPAVPTMPNGTANHPPAVSATPPASVVPANVRLRVMGARVVHTVLRPPGYTIIWGIALVGLSILALELALAALLLIVQTLTMRRMGGTYLRVRTPQTATPRSTGQHRSAGEDLFRAAHDMLPIQGMLGGRAPWLAFVLVGRVDEPTEFGAFVGGERRQRHIWAGALRKIILGQVMDALVDDYPISQPKLGDGAAGQAVADPLGQVLSAGRVILWRDFGLSAPPTYPLRFHDDTDRSDLRPAGGGLAAASGCRTDRGAADRPPPQRLEFAAGLAGWRHAAAAAPQGQTAACALR